MEKNRRFSLLTFPQLFDGTQLTLNIVVVPRNQNPLLPAIENDATIPDAPAFADASLRFEAKIISGLGTFPHSLLANDTKALAVSAPTNARALFEALAKHFSIDLSNPSNQDLTPNVDRPKAAVAAELSVMKYLPQSYRGAFNFTTPRTRNAVTDDSYHCAVRDAGKVPGFGRSSDTISWGKVFAYALRQPQLAKQLGMIYATQFTVDAAHFPHGGWLYVDLVNPSDYRAQQQADDTFIKRYAARIPALKAGTARQVFAPLLFPVLFKAAPADPDPAPDGNYDGLFIETAAYDDGFAKIVHANQPRSRNLLAEESDGAHPVKDLGIRLGWDDEQILIWYMRQLMIDPSVTATDQRLDAPLGVFGYAIDVLNANNPAAQWESLNQVQSNAPLTLAQDTTPGAATLPLGAFAGELPYQVYPVQLDGNINKTYWLPMYFANWTGHSMVLPDDEAAEIYHTTGSDVQADPEKTIDVGKQDPSDPEYPNKKKGTGVTGGAKNRLNTLYAAAPLTTKLRYGTHYEFRVRLRDTSGGGPAALPTVNPINETPSQKGKCQFKRYVAPNTPRLENLPFNTDGPSAATQLRIRRPILGYPAAVYTGKYADAVQRLKDASDKMLELDPTKKKVHEAFGIADPDVNRVEITVEVQALRMDNLLSVSGKDNYVALYTTTRFFPVINDEDDYEAAVDIPVVYRDCKVLHTGAEVDLTNDLQLPGDIDDLDAIFVPTARTIRLTIRAVCEDKADNGTYYGLLNDGDHDRDVRFGHIVQLMLYKPSSDETDLFVDATPEQTVQGIYLQPDVSVVRDGRIETLLIGRQVDKPADMIQRLAKQLDLESLGLTLTAPKGERVQFGCSHRIRHTLAPECSSLTFASKGDLMNHWLCCINLQIDRDWTWDALQDRSLVITRTVRFTHDDPLTDTETTEVGDIEIRRTASFESLHGPKRNYTRVVFIDAVEPKNHRAQPAPHTDQKRFPDTIEVSYSISTRFKAGHAAQHDAALPLALRLPITTPPAQTAKIASAGIALSPYHRNEKYSATEPRQRFLWIEFDEAIRDPNDTYFVRVLAYAPDQLISNNHPELLIAPNEPALPIDPEPIRVIAPGAANDLAGVHAMQPMQKATDSDRHYLLPLPPGLHADAAEMFGFFTYEFRVGHHRNADTNEMVWCTAQGRFGRPLRATGIQHPAPTLTCTVNRDEAKLYVSAPYAEAVHEGKNVTAEPPRTQLWCLLYAQVRQADNQDFRNILLDDKPLDWRVQVEDEPERVDWFTKYDDQQRRTLKTIAVRSLKDELSYGQFRHVFKLAETEQRNADATKYGTAVWINDEVSQLLQLFGLPNDLPLSVLVVEILPTITNVREHVSFSPARGATEIPLDLGVVHLFSAQAREQTAAVEREQPAADRPSPVSDELFHHRILRTSPLTEVPFVCCPTA